MNYAKVIGAMSACIMLATAGAGAAVRSADVSPNADVTLYLGTPSEISGVRVHNYWPGGFRLEIEGLTAIPGGTPVQEGFQLLDNTLLDVRTDHAVDGNMRLRVRIRYADAARRMGLSLARARELVLMRRGRKVGGEMMWMPIREAMRRRGIAAAKRMKGGAVFTLGAWGNDPDDQYVWGVLDAAGSYAVGIPEPSAVGLLAGGAVFMVLGRRRQGA